MNVTVYFKCLWSAAVCVSVVKQDQVKSEIERLLGLADVVKVWCNAI